MTNHAAAVTTAPRPNGVSYLTATLDSLALAGWDDPVIFADSNMILDLPARASAKHLGSWGNFVRAISTLWNERPTADVFVVFQDDLLVASGLRRWLDGQLWPEPLPGVMSLYCSKVTAEEFARGVGWFAMPQDDLPRKAYGSLGVVMPPAAVRLLVRDPPGSGSKNQTDYWLGRFCRDHGLPYLLHSPSLLRHVGRTSCFERGGERPITRDWNDARREGEWVPDAADLA